MKDVCELINGRAYSKNELLESGKYRVLRVGNFFTNNHWYWSDLELEPSKYCENGDLLYAWSASFGPRIWRDERCIYHYHIWKVRPVEEIATRDFLFYFFEWDKERIRAEQGAGATMVHVSKQSMEARNIPVPPLDEQKRIVAALDQAFAALDRARANSLAGLSDAEELRRTIVSECLENALNGSVERTHLGELCSIARGGSPRPIQKFLTSDSDGVNWIKISDATSSGMFIEHTQQKISRDGMSRSRYVTPGSFLLTNSMSFGRPYILKTDGCIHDGWLVLEPDYDLVDQEYLYFLLGSRQVYTEFDRLAAGSTVRNLNIDLVSRVQISLPAMDRQRDAVVSIKKATRVVDELARHYSGQVSDSEALRQSLLQAAFSGQLS